jgi:two-component system, OmpR family, sensor kinase
LSLRNRILLMVLVLMASAVVAADLVTSSEVHGFLISRLDAQITGAQAELSSYVQHVYQDATHDDASAKGDPVSWLKEMAAPPGLHQSHLPDDPGDGHGLTATGLSSHISPDLFVEIVSNDRTMVYEHQISALDSPPPPPELPADLRPESGPGAKTIGSLQRGQPAFSLGAVGSPSTEYRAEAASIPGGVLVVAASSAPSQSTFSSLVHTEILVSIVVLVVLAILIGWLVRIGLRPLEDMTVTAGAFAKGDLSRRVRFADERTEVGRLGGALNGMLVQIESAFMQRQKSEERLRRFVADASHDLRTPLTSIRGYAELLRKGAYSKEDDRRQALGRIEHEAERMAVLVDDLLLLARLDQGRPLAKAHVELRPLVADAVAAARAVDPERRISFDAPHGVLITGDGGRLRQAVDNLLRNALEHTPARTPVEVSVGVTPVAATVSVADRGPGLTPEETERVFERFFQTDPSRTGRGTGLGLSIVAAVAEAHGGRTWVDSVQGEGSTFHLELPLERSSEGSDPLAEVEHGEPTPATRA